MRLSGERGKKRERGISVILAGTCCSGSHAVAPTSSRSPVPREGKSWRGVVPGRSRSAPARGQPFVLAAPQQGGLQLSVYTYFHSYNELNSALENEVFPNCVW